MSDASRTTIASQLPRYGRLPRPLLRDPSITDRAVRLYGLLDDYAGAAGQAFPSRARLAGHLGCSTDSVDRAVRCLVDAGWLAKEVRRRDDRTYDSTLYTLLAHPVENLGEGSRTHAATSRTGAEGIAAPVRTEGEPREGEPPTPAPLTRRNPVDSRRRDRHTGYKREPATRRNPPRDKECPDHVGEWADNCRLHAADRLERTPGR